MEERRVLLERSEQLALLDDLREAAAAGRGSVALVEGPAGIGKTSLLAATRDRAKRVGVSVLSARAALLERDLAWNVVRQLFAAVIGAREIERAELLSGACALATPALGLPAADLPAGAEAGALH